MKSKGGRRCSAFVRVHTGINNVTVLRKGNKCISEFIKTFIITTALAHSTSLLLFHISVYLLSSTCNFSLGCCSSKVLKFETTKIQNLMSPSSFQFPLKSLYVLKTNFIARSCLNFLVSPAHENLFFVTKKKRRKKCFSLLFSRWQSDKIS